MRISVIGFINATRHPKWLFGHREFIDDRAERKKENADHKEANNEYHGMEYEPMKTVL